MPEGKVKGWVKLNCTETFLRGGTLAKRFAVAERQRQYLLKQRAITQAAMGCGVGEVFIACNLRIRIGFKKIELAVVGQAIIHARVAGEVQVTVDALGQQLDLLL